MIRDDAIASLRRFATTDPADRTPILREVAVALVDAREHFFTSDGSTDWRGRTYAYRRFVGEVFAGANLPHDEVGTVQAAACYHVGNVLRERLDVETLESLGLRAESPKERSVEKRAGQADALSVVRGGTAFEDAEEIAQAVKVATILMGRVNADALRGLPAAARRTLAEAAEGLAEAAHALAVVAGAGRRAGR